MKFASAYANHTKVAIQFHDEDGNHDGLTEQHHKADTDINNIIRKYDRTGLIQHVNRATAAYGDYTESNEYQDALNVVLAADRSFMGIPSHIRAKFDHDAGKFFEFATDPQNASEMVELGLAIAPVKESPMKVEVVNTAPDTGAEDS